MTEPGELSGSVPALDVDGTTAEQIARKARAQIGRPRRRRWIVPIVAAVVAAAYGVWAILQALEAMG